jgi:hypothetical protein
MELVYVTVIGAGLATIMRYVLPGRQAYGVALLPALGAAVTAAVWVALLWAGLTFDGGWIWVISLTAAVVVPTVVAVVLSRGRTASDARELHILSGGRPSDVRA